LFSWLLLSSLFLPIASFCAGVRHTDIFTNGSQLVNALCLYII
jgi:hypothetical protein